MGKLNEVKQNKEGFEQAKKSINQDLVNCLKAGRITKKEAMEVSGYETERGVRQQIQLISLFYPVISTSDVKGYKIINRDNAKTNQDKINNIEELDHTINEIQSRIKALNKKLKPLIAEKQQTLKELGYR